MTKQADEYGEQCLINMLAHRTTSLFCSKRTNGQPFLYRLGETFCVHVALYNYTTVFLEKCDTANRSLKKGKPL